MTSTPLTHFLRLGILASLPAPLLLAQGAAEYPTSQLVTGEMRDLLQVESVDFDGDGANDLIGYSDAFNALMWQRGDGSTPLGPERFGPPQVLLDLPDLEESTIEPRLFELADVTGDGLDDVILSNRPARAVQLIENLGGGSVAPPVVIFDTSVGGGNVRGTGTTALDADGDGDLDLALFVRVNNGPPSYARLLVNSGGSFVASPLPTFPLPGYFAAADLDGDGDTDLASAGIDNGWLRNDAGSFTLVPLASSTASGRIAYARDFDGDGDVDLAFEPSSDPLLVMYENTDGMGAFGLPVTIVLPRQPVAYLDMDGDGDLDFVHPDASLGRLMWTALEPGLQAGVTSLFVGRNGLIASLEAVDLDGDGLEELLVRDMFQGQSCYQGQAPSGQVALGAEEIYVASKLAGLSTVVPVDFDLDGSVDLVTSQFNRDVSIQFLDSNGDIERTESLAGSPTSVQEIEVADVNGDGRPDLLIVELVGPIFLYLGQPGGTVSAAIQLDPTGRYRSVEALDLDQDGDLDIVGGGSEIGDKDLVAFDQVAPGQFATAPRLLSSFNGSIYSVEVADLDLDGIDDLCVSATNAFGIPRHFLCRSVGDGSIERTSLQRAFDLQPLLPVDLDGDGDSDFIWVDDDNARILARENLGGGNVSGAFDFLVTGRRVFRPVLTHLNTDGIPDLLITELDGGEDDRRIFRSLSRGYLDYGPLEALEFADPGASRIAVSDIDGDMDRDVFGFLVNAGTIELYRSTLFAEIGTSECGPAVPNSTGAPGELAVRGSLVAENSALQLMASGLPAQSLTLFLTSQDAGFVVGPGGSMGNLCLGGSIGRFLDSGGVQTSSALGAAELGVNLREVPQPTGTVTATAGQTWRFQAWHRDAVGGQGTSNFTQAVRVMLL